MAQIIDIEERRKPRAPHHLRAQASTSSLVFDPVTYMDQVVAPVASWWQSWFASWGSLWLAPWGLQILPVEPPPPPASKTRAGPRS